jgi:hypothetical protein
MRRLAVVVLGVLAACGAHAQMYRWVDENGRVQYTQTPPPPGRQGQEIKPRTSAPAAKAEPAGKSAPAAPAESAQRPADKAKAAATGGEKEEITADARRMTGEWRTHPGARVQVRFQLRQDGSTLKSEQAWTVGGESHATSGMKVRISGGNGSGMVSQDTSDRLPTPLRYELRGGALILTVDSGPYAGTHLLTRNR